MLISEVARDEGFRSLMIRLTKGRLTPEQWIKPLESVSALQYIAELQIHMEKYLDSIFRKRAIKLLMFVIVICCHFRCRMSESKEAVPDCSSNIEIMIEVFKLGSVVLGNLPGCRCCYK